MKNERFVENCVTTCCAFEAVKAGFWEDTQIVFGVLNNEWKLKYNDKWNHVYEYITVAMPNIIYLNPQPRAQNNK